MMRSFVEGSTPRGTVSKDTRNVSNYLATENEVLLYLPEIDEALPYLCACMRTYERKLPPMTEFLISSVSSLPLLKTHKRTLNDTMAPSSSFTDAPYCISYKDVLKAAERIEGVAHKTPVLTSNSFNKDGRRLFFKVEAMQRTGSFKFRGALNAIKSHVSSSSQQSELSVVTHSSGNHAAAVALASTLASTPSTRVTATIVMPNNAPTIKKAGVIGFGGNIVSVENTPQAREEAADEILSKSVGSIFVHPSEDPKVIAGQGTVSLELVEQVKELGCEKLDAVIIPVGGGGLASGNTIALRGMLGDRIKVRLFDCTKRFHFRCYVYKLIPTSCHRFIHTCRLFLQNRKSSMTRNGRLIPESYKSILLVSIQWTLSQMVYERR